MSFAAAAAFVVLLAALHVLKPELDPSWRMGSEYAIGDYGWVMRIAFFSMALSCVALFVLSFSTWLMTISWRAIQLRKTAV